MMKTKQQILTPQKKKLVEKGCRLVTKVDTFVLPH